MVFPVITNGGVRRMKSAKILSVRVSGAIYRDGDRYMAKCPSLGLVTCGKTTKDADKKMDKAIDMWAKYLVDKGNIIDRLDKWGIDYRIEDAPVTIPFWRRLVSKLDDADKTWLTYLPLDNGSISAGGCC